MNANTKKMLSIREKFAGWLNSPLGQRVFESEREQLEDILPGLFGYHILQYGNSTESNYLTPSRITTKTILCLDDAEIEHDQNAIRCHAEDLPVAADSIDVIVLPHILEYSKDAHKLLREMERVLIGDGHVVIIGINPISLWGLWHLVLCWWGNMPWSGRLIATHRIKDWLSLLDFEITKSKKFFFLPPFRNEKFLEKLLPWKDSVVIVGHFSVDSMLLLEKNGQSR